MFLFQLSVPIMGKPQPRYLNAGPYKSHGFQNGVWGHDTLSGFQPNAEENVSRLQEPVVVDLSKEQGLTPKLLLHF
jgi:hypothetical protein